MKNLPQENCSHEGETLLYDRMRGYRVGDSIFTLNSKWQQIDGTWKCPECGKIFGKREPLISHFWYSHTEEGKEFGARKLRIMTERARVSPNRLKDCPYCKQQIGSRTFKSHLLMCKQITPNLIRECEKLYLDGYNFENIRKQLGFTFSKGSFDRYVYSQFDPKKRDEARETRKKKSISRTIRSMFDAGLLCRVPVICDLSSPDIFRTAKEKEVATILVDLSIKFEYESFCLRYITRKGQNTIYIPDFYLPYFHLILEIKGDRSYSHPKTWDTAKAAIDHGYKFKLILNKTVSEEHIKRILRSYGYKG